LNGYFEKLNGLTHVLRRRERKREKKKDPQHQIEAMLNTCTTWEWRDHRGDSNVISEDGVWPPSVASEVHKHYQQTDTCNAHINYFLK